MAKLKRTAEDLLAQCREAIAEEYPDSTPDRDWDPLVEMAVLANDPNLARPLRAGLNKELANYFYAKRKAIEHSGGDTGAQVLLVQFSPNSPNGIAVLPPTEPEQLAPPAPDPSV